MHSGIVEALEAGPLTILRLEQFCRMRRTDFRRRLNHLIAIGVVIRDGHGIPGDPYIYSLRGWELLKTCASEREIMVLGR